MIDEDHLRETQGVVDPVLGRSGVESVPGRLDEMDRRGVERGECWKRY